VTSNTVYMLRTLEDPPRWVSDHRLIPFHDGPRRATWFGSPIEAEQGGRVRKLRGFEVVAVTTTTEVVERFGISQTPKGSNPEEAT